MFCSSILMCLGMSWLLSSLVFGACQNKLIVRLRRYAQHIRKWGLCKWGGESPHFAYNRLQWCSDSLRPIAAHTHTHTHTHTHSSVSHAGIPSNSNCTWCVLLSAVYCNWLQMCSSVTLFCRSNFCYVFRPTEAIFRETLIQRDTFLIQSGVVGVRTSNKIAVKTWIKLIIKLIIIVNKIILMLYIPFPSSRTVNLLTNNFSPHSSIQNSNTAATSHAATWPPVSVLRKDAHSAAGHQVYWRTRKCASNEYHKGAAGGIWALIGALWCWYSWVWRFVFL
jgi:hypothetical protein